MNTERSRVLTVYICKSRAKGEGACDLQLTSQKLWIRMTEVYFAFLTHVQTTFPCHVQCGWYTRKPDRLNSYTCVLQLMYDTSPSVLRMFTFKRLIENRNCEKTFEAQRAKVITAVIRVDQRVNMAATFVSNPSLQK